MIRACAYCEQNFKSIKGRKYCSSECYNRYRADQKNTPQTSKVCNACGVEKPAEDFYTTYRGRLHSECRECTIARNSKGTGTRSRDARHADLTGTQFGWYTVTGLDEYDPRRSSRRWLCECRCGTVKSLTTGAIMYSVRGKTKQKIPHSCGCGKIEAARNRTPFNVLAPGESNFATIYAGYKLRAQGRGLSFNLSRDEVRALFQGDCFYCGVKPSQAGQAKRSNGAFVYNGIDRVDNEQGYDLDNCVPCCKQCNYAKRAQTLEEFSAWITRVIRHNTTDV